MVTQPVRSTGVCAYCGAPSEGNFSVHRDGFFKGPEVPLCDACGKDPKPTLEEIWKRISRATDFRPSEVALFTPLPLVGTLGRTEREVAAALLVRACQVNGDTWQPVSPAMVGETLKRDVAEGVQPFASLNSNPFVRPNFGELVEHGYAAGDLEKGEPLSLTDKALVEIAKYRRPAAESSAG